MIFVLMLVTFVATILCIAVFIKSAPRLGFIDAPNERSMHTSPIPRGAGICFVGVSLVISLVALLWNINHLQQYYYVYAAVAIVFAAGLLDDRKGLSPKLKFLFIILAIMLLCVNDLYIKTLGNYMGFKIDLPLYIAVPFTIFAMAGFTNALNLTDGLDGLAGMISMVMMGAFLWIGYVNHDELMIMLSSVFMAAVAAFLIFNWHPAKVFMGDSGSLTLGFVISILAVRAMEFIEPTAVLFIVVLPVLDTFIVMTRRIQRGLSPFSADKTHMHHILYNRYEDVPYTTILLVYIQIAFTIIGVQLRHSDNFLSLILFGILFFIFLNLFDQRIKRRKKVKR
ncbi:glycosyltransferase family 4 protein [Hydrogenimonas cancrithermarum]|uniref:Undecaprenyl-phosphate alpha-N-acetylglucosaminyl 1-phosphate transferase n=1 Tax=Hydrogenimonas cancrithermarum TaxID=2993563 RepID=A0ABM8FNY1_9BACT|nr:MraY family glycosyltransferase [Hydrogenimonas cancrithermarum]BDY13587.1 undecaprenyl-phosphate alpha-N-acetylglucosaminyl 1-phosphate transferase [Hydrogenimonas cancrithermarum]